MGGRDLEQIDSLIAGTRSRIDRQRELIRSFKSAGYAYDAARGEALLLILEESLSLFEVHKKMIQWERRRSSPWERPVSRSD